MITVDDNDLETAESALENAAGKVRPEFEPYFLKIESIYDSVGWVEYVSKAIDRTRRLFPSVNIVAVSNDLRSTAKSIYEADRREINERAKSLWEAPGRAILFSG